MKIVFLGSGNVATHLAVALKELGHEIVQVYSRTYENAEALAVKIGAEPTDRVARIMDTADLYIFAVKDDALLAIIAEMPHQKGIWIHTAGSISMNVFSPYTKEYGVLYPLQTFSKGKKMRFSGIPLFIEGSSAGTTNSLEELAGTLSEHVHHLSGEKRLFLHLAAVFACNFVNHMYTLAAEIIDEEGIPFDVLKPLIMEAAAKVMEMAPVEAQTGPAVRGDQKVMRAHMELINPPATRELYTLLSESIHSHTRTP